MTTGTTTARATQVTQRVQLSDGGSLCVELQGTRTDQPPLMLLRPLGGSMALWGELAARLGQRRQIVAFDPRGVGASSDPPWFQTTRQMAADAVAVLDALGLDRADVFGLSLGGMVASWLAIDHPLRVERLVLASTLPRAKRISRHVYTEVLGLLRWALVPGVEAEVGLVRQILSMSFRLHHPERVLAISDQIRRSPARRKNLALLALAAARHDAEHLLPSITAETLILVGALDPIAGARSQAELLYDLPHARLCILPDCGHDLSLEQPESTALEVDRFLLGGARA